MPRVRFFVSRLSPAWYHNLNAVCMYLYRSYGQKPNVGGYFLCRHTCAHLSKWTKDRGSNQRHWGYLAGTFDVGSRYAVGTLLGYSSPSANFIICRCRSAYARVLIPGHLFLAFTLRGFTLQNIPALRQATRSHNFGNHHTPSLGVATVAPSAPKPLA